MTTQTSRTLVSVKLGAGPIPEVFIDKALIRAAVLSVLFGAGYLLIGLIVANSNGFFAGLETLDDLASAAGVVLFWPLQILGISIDMPA